MNKIKVQGALENSTKQIEFLTEQLSRYTNVEFTSSIDVIKYNDLALKELD